MYASNGTRAAHRYEPSGMPSHDLSAGHDSAAARRLRSVPSDMAITVSPVRAIMGPGSIRAIAEPDIAQIQPDSSPGEQQVGSDFTRVEWVVILLARNDPLTSLCEPSRIRRLLDRLLGPSFNPRFADPRLEALRRMAVVAWHHDAAMPVSEIEAFLAGGFSTGQLEMLLARVADSRSLGAAEL